MPGSLSIGLSGLQANQEMLNVVGNNLANSNTTGFKSQSVSFADLLSQTLAPATGPTSQGSGGTNPAQEGLGVRVSGTDTNFQQGSLQETGSELDVALQGAGFFVVNNAGQDVYTRAGSFGVDAQNFLVDPSTGARVQRFGSVGEGGPGQVAFQKSGDNDIQLPYGSPIPGKATTQITLQGNLAANAVGPLAQTLTSAAPFQSGGAPATAATLLNSLSDITTPYAAGDQLQIQGTTSGGTTVSATLAVSATTTLGDLISQINTSFPDATASLDSSGNLVVKANATGPSKLGLTLSDAAGDTGSFPWSNHGLATTTTGKDGDTVTTGIQIYDSQGNAHTLSLQFQKQGANSWSLTGSMAAADGTLTDNLVSGITFNTDGSFQQVNGTGAGNASMTALIPGVASPQTISFSFGSSNGFNGLTQAGGSSSANATGQDGYAPGSLSSVSIGQDGVITGLFTNGQTQSLAQLAIASFANPGGLDRSGSNYYTQSVDSGLPQVGAGLAGGRGSVNQKALESSNVDMAQQFTLLIVGERGYQANARTITVSDAVLQDLMQIIR